MADTDLEIGEQTSNPLEELTKKQVEELREAFELFDEDHSGEIGQDELEKCFKRFGYNFTLEEVEAIFDKVDVDGSGQIDFAEFVEMMKDQVSTMECDDDFDTAWSVYLGLGSAATSFNAKMESDRAVPRLDTRQLAKVMRNLDLEFSEAEIEQMIDQVDTNKRGQITQEELGEWLETMKGQSSSGSRSNHVQAHDLSSAVNALCTIQ